jgi:hypothetical protein
MDDLDAMLNDLTAGSGASTKPTDTSSDPSADLNDMLAGLESTTISAKAAKPLFQDDEKVTIEYVDEEINPLEVKTDDLDGLIVRRLPISEPDWNTGGTNDSMEYQVENTREYPIVLRIVFTGTNVQLSPLGQTQLESDMTCSAVLGPAESFLFCSLTAANKDEKYQFKAKIQVTPSNQKETSTEELEGVVLTRIITHDEKTHIQYSCKNNKEFAVTCVIDIKGNDWTAGPDFKKEVVVEPDQEVEMGSISSSEDIASSWSWKGMATQTADGVQKEIEPDVAESELEGVVLIRAIYPSIDGAPGEVRFNIKNTRDHDIKVTIGVEGDVVGESDVEGVVKAGETSLVGAVKVLGQMSINWKWQESKN